MGRTYRYDDEQYGNNYSAFRRFKQKQKKNEEQERQEEWQVAEVSVHVIKDD